MAQQGYEEDRLRRWFPEDAEGAAKHLNESDICGIAEVLTSSSRDAWSRIPRIYSILRKIGELDAIDAFIDDGFTDVSFPFSGTTLPEALRDHSARLRFLELQHLVYHTEALDLERQARHGHFNDPRDVPLKKVGELGKGGFGYVDRVVSTISHKEYARKLISRGKTLRKDKQVLRAFTRELSNLKGLSHRHLVKLAGSYTDRKWVAIIMLPVADMNLQTFLDKSDLDDTSRSFLRPFFGCLTSALSYLHDNRIRHKDIKPSNVLIKHDQVYLTDFGTSLDWSGCDNSTTLTAPPTTPRYCAPEVMAFVERNTSSDIWSLGCVFLEMWTVLKRHTPEDLKSHMSSHGTHVKEYHHNLEAIASWIKILENSMGPSCDLAPSQWIQNMLQHQPRSRWNCHVLANHIQEASTDPSSEYAFKGLCCLEPDDDTSDETQSSESFDEQSETGSITRSPPTLSRNISERITPLTSLDISQPGSLTGAESVKTADLVPPIQTDTPVPYILVNDYHVPPGAFVGDESESLSREINQPSVSTKASGDVDIESDDTMSLAAVSDNSGSSYETSWREDTNKTPSRASPTGPLPYSTTRPKNTDMTSGSLAHLSIYCTLCASMLYHATDSARLPCFHWIHKSCYAQGNARSSTACSTCNLADRKPASQSNRNFHGDVHELWKKNHRNRVNQRSRDGETQSSIPIAGKNLPSPHISETDLHVRFELGRAQDRRTSRSTPSIYADSGPPKHGVVTEGTSKKRGPRSEKTETKQKPKKNPSIWKNLLGVEDRARSDRDKIPAKESRSDRKFTGVDDDPSDDLMSRYEAFRKKRIEEEAERLREAERERLERRLKRRKENARSDHEFTSVDRESSADEKARYERLYKKLIEDEAILNLGSSGPFVEPATSGQPQRSGPIYRDYPRRPTSAGPRVNVVPARSAQSQHESGHPRYRTVKREPSSSRPKVLGLRPEELSRSYHAEWEENQSGDDSDAKEEGNTTIQADMDLKKLGVLLEEVLHSQHMTHRSALTTKTYHAYRRFPKGDTDLKISGGLQEVIALMQKQQDLMYQDLDQKMSGGPQSQR
ncbi:DnaJ-like protein [Alternaria alternata]|nr:DnaJ-like protein [Alternaria alternata]